MKGNTHCAVVQPRVQDGGSTPRICECHARWTECWGGWRGPSSSAPFELAPRGGAGAPALPLFQSWQQLGGV